MRNCFENKDRQESLRTRPWRDHNLAQGLNQLFSSAGVGSSINTVLDVGCGAAGRSTKALRSCFSNARVIAIDNSIAALEMIYQDGTIEESPYVSCQFGDPEFALPDEKADLIVLSLVCHCFEHLYRALGNLITHALKDDGYVLFVHRTDPFMKAVCGAALSSADYDNRAAAIMAELWKQSKVWPKSKYRLISEHDIISYYLKLAGASLLATTDFSIRVDENIAGSIRAKHYSPLFDLASEFTDHLASLEGVLNETVQLTLYLYQITAPVREVELACCIKPVSLHSAILELGEIRALATRKHDDRDLDSFRQKAKTWFTKDSSIEEADLPYGFYVDLRGTHNAEDASKSPRTQLWPVDEEFWPVDGESQTEGSMSLIRALDAGDQRQEVFFCLVWIYLPDIRAASPEYKIMPQVVQSGTVDIWRLVPYVNDMPLDALKRYLKDVIVLRNEEEWKALMNYMGSLYKRARPKNIHASYYFRFKNVHHGEKPIAFSFQAATWLTLTEVMQLAVVSQSALAAINDGLSAYRARLVKEYDQFREKLRTVASQLRTLEAISEEVRELREMVDPDLIVPGTTAFMSLGKVLAEKAFPQGDLHVPAGHFNSNLIASAITQNAGILTELEDALVQDRFGIFNMELVNHLLAPIAGREERARGDPVLISVALARSIASHRLPLAWVILALNGTVNDDHWRYFWDMAGAELCMQVLKAIAVVGKQMRVRNIQWNEGDKTIVASLNYDKDYPTFIQRVNKVICRTETEPERGSLRQAFRWLQAGGVEPAIADSALPHDSIGLLVFQERNMILKARWERYLDKVEAMRGSAGSW